MWRALLWAAAYLERYVEAHGGAGNYTVGDVWYPGYDPYGDLTWEDTTTSDIPQRKWITNNPIFEVDNASLPCNTPGNPAHFSIPITAGENITAVYWYWVHTVGPMIAYMTPCNGPCSTFDPTGASWFKIGQKGLLSGTIQEGMWFQKQFSMWDGTGSMWSETIPATLKAGEYLVRHEIIALHSENKPQFYPECVHVTVSGNGTKLPGEEYLAKIPGVYSMDDPNININIYSPAVANLTVYNIPGPPVWRG